MRRKSTVEKMSRLTAQSEKSMLQDWLQYIHEVNIRSERIIRNGKEFHIPFMAIPTAVVEKIFVICDQFDFTPNTRYLALYIFDKFMCNHFWESRVSFNKDLQNGDSDLTAWMQVCQRISNLSKLRLMSCIQIASKVDSHSKGLSISQVMSVLQDIDGRNEYTANSVLTSEFKVFKGVNFKIPLATPLDCMQILIAATNLDETKNFYNIAIDILDLSYLQHQQLYSQLQFSIKGRATKSDEERKNFMAMEINIPYLSASVVLCTALILNFRKNETLTIASKLANLALIEANDIWGMANLLFAMATQKDD